jgi:hypothetical protein
MSEHVHETILATPTDGSNEELVTVAAFPDPVEANLARAALDSAGIESFMYGENANSMLPVAFLARLQVRRPDETRARRVLDGADNEPESLSSVTAAEQAAEGEER